MPGRVPCQDQEPMWNGGRSKYKPISTLARFLRHRQEQTLHASQERSCHRSPTGLRTPDALVRLERDAMFWKWLATKPAERGRPHWGYCRVVPATLCRLWLGYRSGFLKRTDLQTWFAAQELRMRRCTMRKERKPLYTIVEFASLTGLRESAIKASIRRLEHANLLSWSEHALVIDDGTTGLVADVAGLREMLDQVVNHRRTLPVPRQTVLLLARTRRPVLMATMLGHLFRGMYYRSAECVSWGTCKAAWIADAFGVDVRNAKSARRELRELGWMRDLDSPHWHRQRYGQSFVIALAWSDRKRPRTISPPRTVQRARKSPPPESYRNLPSGFEYQKRPRGRPSGLQGNCSGKPPTLRHVVPADLSDPLRTAVLFHQATRAGLVPDDVCHRLRFVALSQRATRLAANPGGFFMAVVRRRLWHHVTQHDEDAARRSLASRCPEFLNAGTFMPPLTPERSTPIAPGRSSGPDPDELARVREMVRQSLLSVCDSPQSLDNTARNRFETHSAPAHLMADGIFRERTRGQGGDPGTHGAKAFTPGTRSRPSR